MAPTTLGANMRSKTPRSPGAVPDRGDPHERRAVSRGDRGRRARLEPVSDSVTTRPGSSSSTLIRYSRVRPIAVTLNRVIVPTSVSVVRVQDGTHAASLVLGEAMPQTMSLVRRLLISDKGSLDHGLYSFAGSWTSHLRAGSSEPRAVLGHRLPRLTVLA